MTVLWFVGIGVAVIVVIGLSLVAVTFGIPGVVLFVLAIPYPIYDLTRRLLLDARPAAPRDVAAVHHRILIRIGAALGCLLIVLSLAVMPRFGALGVLRDVAPLLFTLGGVWAIWLAASEFTRFRDAGIEGVDHPNGIADATGGPSPTPRRLAASALLIVLSVLFIAAAIGAFALGPEGLLIYLLLAPVAIFDQTKKQLHRLDPAATDAVVSRARTRVMTCLFVWCAGFALIAGWMVLSIAGAAANPHVVNHYGIGDIASLLAIAAVAFVPTWWASGAVAPFLRRAAYTIEK